VPAYGYRLVEPDGRRMLPERLDAFGVRGPDVGRLQREGTLRTAGGTVDLDDVSRPRPGQRFAFVMDTKPCAGAERLAPGVDLLVCEATFAERDRELAEAYLHMTARQAGELAASAGARRLVLTHFSQRYDDLSGHRSEALEEFGDVVVAVDLQRVAVPARVA